jgi:Zn-dependent protease
MPTGTASGAVLYCDQCGAPIEPLALSCSKCQRLVYSERLKAIANQAGALYRAGNREGARSAWASAIPLLPPNSTQADAIRRTLERLDQEIAGGPAGSARAEIGPPPQEPPSWAKRLGPLAPLVVLLLKFKWVLLFLATKGKLLLLGLTNFKMILSMAAFIGVYWAMFGWWFAIGFAGSIFIHEMGHYVTVRRYGFAAEGPVFLPGLGAYVRWHGINVDPLVRSRISLAGPLFGMLASIAAYAIYFATEAPVWLAVGHIGAYINLFNLIPVFIFDGNSAMKPLGRQHRVAVLITALSMLFITREFMFLFVGLGTGYRLFFLRDFPEKPSDSTAYYFIFLMIALGLLSWFGASSGIALQSRGF